MEAASIPRGSRRRRRRRAPSAKAQWALALYAAAALVAWLLATGAWHGGPERAGATAGAGVTAPDGQALALDSVAARTTRSVVPIGERLGFVAWTYRGSSLVVTVGGRVGEVLQVERYARLYDAEIVRSDAGTGLALARVDGDVGRPLWQERRPVDVRDGDWLVAVGRDGGTQLEATSARYAGIAVRGAFEPLAGAPVLSQSGRLVGVVGATGVIPIGRACGTIRRCG